MKKLIFIFLILTFFSCKNSNEKATEKETQILEKAIKNKLDMYITFLDSLNVYDISSINIAKEYIVNELTVSEALADSAYYLFLEFFYTTANNLTDSLELKYPNLMDGLNRNDEDSEVREFYSLLSKNGLELFMTEGMFYVDVKPDFFYDTFKNNLSPSLKEFLQLRNNELKNAFSEDANLLISFDNLSERVYKWEKYLIDYPETKLINEANYYYEIYLETFLTGMDNTPLFDWDIRILVPEVKKSYESYIKDHPDTKSGKIIQEYYDILKRNQFEYSDSIEYILKKYNLSSMYAIQPHLR